MTQEQHPITPSFELVEKWYKAIPNSSTSWKQELATQAARWGADVELTAICVWLATEFPREGAVLQALRKTRRPKPPSLADQALEQLRGIETCFLAMHGGGLIDDVIYAALKRLKELEEEKQ